MKPPTPQQTTCFGSSFPLPVHVIFDTVISVCTELSFAFISCCYPSATLLWMFCPWTDSVLQRRQSSLHRAISISCQYLRLPFLVIRWSRNVHRPCLLRVFFPSTFFLTAAAYFSRRRLMSANVSYTLSVGDYLRDNVIPPRVHIVTDEWADAGASRPVALSNENSSRLLTRSLAASPARRVVERHARGSAKTTYSSISLCVHRRDNAQPSTQRISKAEKRRASIQSILYAATISFTALSYVSKYNITMHVTVQDSFCVIL